MLGSPPGGVRFELVLPDGPLEGRDDPFTTLSDAGRFARVYLARILMGSTPIRWVALKVRRSVPRIPDAPPTNAAVDERWERELATLRAASTSGVARFLDPGPEEDRGRPVTFCRTTRKTFHPLCPVCLGPLRDCRDDALLASVGLPAYSQSPVRFLTCAACAPPVPVFFSESAAPEGSTADVRGFARLVRDGGMILRTEVSEDARERLERQFPCYRCELREECYPEGADPETSIPAETRLMPFSFHDLQAIPLEALPLGYGDVADLLGGASWETMRARLAAEGTPEALLAPLDESFNAAPMWMHAGDKTGRFPVEALTLKLALFAQAARGVKAIHEAAGRAILGVGPASFRVEAGGAGPGLPAAWSFRAKAIDVGGEDPGPDGAAPEADLRGLARLYFRALLVHDGQDEAAVEAAVGRVSEKLKSSFPADAAPPDPKSVTDLLPLLIDPEKPAFDRASVVYARAAREEKENLVAPALWNELVAYGFRLESSIPGFGFAGAVEGPGPVDRALGELEILQRKLRAEAPSRGDRNREIQKACDSVLADLGGPPAAVPGRSSDSTRVR